MTAEDLMSYLRGIRRYVTEITLNKEGKNLLKQIWEENRFFMTDPSEEAFYKKTKCYGIRIKFEFDPDDPFMYPPGTILKPL